MTPRGGGRGGMTTSVEDVFDREEIAQITKLVEEDRCSNLFVCWSEIGTEVGDNVNWSTSPIYDEYDEYGVLQKMRNYIEFVDFIGIDKIHCDSGLTRNFVNLQQYLFPYIYSFYLEKRDNRRRIKKIKYSKYLIRWRGRQQYSNLSTNLNSRTNLAQSGENDAGQYRTKTDQMTRPHNCSEKGFGSMFNWKRRFKQDQYTGVHVF